MISSANNDSQAFTIALENGVKSLFYLPASLSWFKAVYIYGACFVGPVIGLL